MKNRNGAGLRNAPGWEGRTPPVAELDTASQTQESPILVDTRPKGAGPGIEVVEDRAGTAAGQWVLHVRCQCGRRWFELEAVTVSTCPRCGLLVYVEIDVPGLRM